MDKVFTKSDYKILKAIIDRNDKNKGWCMTQGTTIEEIKLKTSLSDKKVRNTIKDFIEVGYVAYGVKFKRTNTYMITIKGFNQLCKLKMNIYEEENK